MFGSLDSNTMPMTVAITAESMVISYMMIIMAKSDRIGLPPVTNGKAIWVPAVSRIAVVKPMIAPKAGNRNSRCWGTCSPNAYPVQARDAGIANTVDPDLEISVLESGSVQARVGLDAEPAVGVGRAVDRGQPEQGSSPDVR